MLWNLAIRTLFHDRGKLIAGLVGVVFSVVLVNIQGGLFSGLMGKAGLLVDRSGADIWVGHRGMHNVDFAHHIPLRWINRVRSIGGVQDAQPMRIAFSEMSLPGGKFESVIVIGVSKGSELGRVYDIREGPADALEYTDGVIVDQCDDGKLVRPAVGDIREIGGHRVRITGKCYGKLSFTASPYVFTTHARSAELTGMPSSSTSYFLVKLDSGADESQVCQEIQNRLPNVSVMTSDAFTSTSKNYWMTRTGIGLSFGVATLLGLLVGLVMVAQTLYAMVLDRIGEYATLKAIGASEKEIVLIMAAQSTVVALVGIAVGTLLSILIQFLLSTPRSEIVISFQLYTASAILVFVICLAASSLPYLRVRRVDPHSVLQG